MRETGLYIHFPFCRRKCLYCDFPSYSGKEQLMDSYLKALKTEMEKWKEPLYGISIKTIFIGGGTPTLFNEAEISGILDCCQKMFKLNSNLEVTIEANPGTLSYNMLYVFKNAGINRLSIGMQAWQDHHLQYLGRIHSSRDVVQNLKWARRVGFDNINVDLMFGLPGQKMDEWLETLKMVCKMGVEHISAYSLKIEEHTPFYKMWRQNELELPSEDLERKMYHMGKEYLQTQGFKQYEISNFALPGRECIHNLIYWNNEEYLGLGSGAHSFLNKERFSNYCEPEKYIKTVLEHKSPTDYRETIGEKEERFETIMLGLRLAEGIDKERFSKRFGNEPSYYYPQAIIDLKNLGLLEEDAKHLRLTSKGLDLQNTVLLHFMD